MHAAKRDPKSIVSCYALSIAHTEHMEWVTGILDEEENKAEGETPTLTRRNQAYMAACEALLDVI